MSVTNEHLIVRRPMNVSELPHHDLSQAVPYPVLMCKNLVPEANAWVLYLYIKEITQALKDIAIAMDRAVPHYHDFDEMYLMIGDEKAITFEVMLGEETYRVETPASVYIPGGWPTPYVPWTPRSGLREGSSRYASTGSTSRTR